MAHVHETVLYADDVAATAAFYTHVLGLRVLFEPDFMAALRVDRAGVLLIFDPQEAAVDGRDVPSHGAVGPGHVAFSVEADEERAIRDRLAALEVSIEREITWPRGGRSSYFRDPAGNSVELVVGEIWPE